MKDSTILKTSLICVFLGIACLYIILETSELEFSEKLDVDNGLEGNDIRIRGVVDKIIRKDNLTIINVRSFVKAVVFEDVELKENSFIEVIGELREYEGNKELLIKEIFIP
ncbi:hypothetical protein CMO90_01660 [Candidatus Woesearchaeota archaeon]|jgi:hypothetical protein|nr:hypothetical protein [Candidatus Woesearchaeota archaeon]|tara:strand:- start:9 stop:341 length:333 start_codon:yes stop_codon:yes gene_type:complete